MIKTKNILTGSRSSSRLHRKLLHFYFPLLLCVSILSGCVLITTPYKITKGAIKTCVFAVNGAYELTAGTTKLMYKIGGYTFKVVRAPLDWTLTHNEIETIDGLPVKEAIRSGRVKNAPYTVKGKTYYPMSIKEAECYSEIGIASWYGYETLKKEGGFMTADGEAFNPKGFTAAHKYLPLPYHIKVTNLENSRSLIVRVNDRGPFQSEQNPSSGDRIVDLSMGAAKKLGFYEKGTARVKVEAIRLQEG
jgi:peptidoglycan lytic transglycosylase